ncbi:hypothetical protein BLNAU_7980 [Blattamonas nauphoetae]|uniref:Uncharacterized protein n=1 Tax=Blattamonas nauphoetae TaxID=2049346 RepID=A0ABQ9Y0A4_9EUKA|nr:hypothetical protein BLNAU_7980 [Blattamonas nauphoetae]
MRGRAECRHVVLRYFDDDESVVVERHVRRDIRCLEQHRCRCLAWDELRPSHICHVLRLVFGEAGLHILRLEVVEVGDRLGRGDGDSCAGVHLSDPSNLFCLTIESTAGDGELAVDTHHKVDTKRGELLQRGWTISFERGVDERGVGFDEVDRFCRDEFELGGVQNEGTVVGECPRVEVGGAEICVGHSACCAGLIFHMAGLHVHSSTVAEKKSFVFSPHRCKTEYNRGESDIASGARQDGRLVCAAKANVFERDCRVLDLESHRNSVVGGKLGVVIFPADGESLVVDFGLIGDGHFVDDRHNAFVVELEVVEYVLHIPAHREVEQAVVGIHAIRRDVGDGMRKVPLHFGV